MCIKISVIIPVYNSEKTLKRCVESITFGSFNDLEIILIDDCSKDKSWEICCDLKKSLSSIKILRNDINRGVSYTRNRGLDIARGEYILFVDSDDWVSGEYASILLENCEQYFDSLVICGFKYIDYTKNYNKLYLYNENEPICKLSRFHFFELYDCIHLQVVWNKIFHKDIIKKNNIKFDENLKMGEDFQFVLDYIEKGNIYQCIVINKSLVYYIRYNNNSLMGDFSHKPFAEAAKGISRLSNICDNKNLELKYINKLKENYTYHIYRDKSLSNFDRKRKIDNLWSDGIGKYKYYEQKILYSKEFIINIKENIESLNKRVIEKFKRYSLQKKIVKIRRQLNQKDFTVISQNCIGGVFYHDMSLPFDSPTINLFFEASDFLRFVKNIPYYINIPLEVKWGEEYPIGKLGDVTIYFMHYETCSEALKSWNRRIKRIHWDKIVILCTDRNGFNNVEYLEWCNIIYPKLLFTVNPEYIENSVIYDNLNTKCVPDIISNRFFYKDNKLLTLINSLDKR